MWSQVDKEMLEREEYAFAGPRLPNEIEQLVVIVRLEQYNRGLNCRAAALHRLLDEHYNVRPLPSVRKIGEILSRHCLTNGRTGWYEGASQDQPSSVR